jgi:hypothetical protein
MWSALIILLFACVLLVANYTEGFENPPGMCGVDLAPCPHGSRCMNGYCMSDAQPSIPPTSGLPVYP